MFLPTPATLSSPNQPSQRSKQTKKNLAIENNTKDSSGRKVSEINQNNQQRNVNCSTTKNVIKEGKTEQPSGMRLFKYSKCTAIAYFSAHTKPRESHPPYSLFVPAQSAAVLLTCMIFPSEDVQITFYFSINTGCRLFLDLNPIIWLGGERKLQRNSFLWTFLNLIITKFQN